MTLVSFLQTLWATLLIHIFDFNGIGNCSPEEVHIFKTFPETWNPSSVKSTPISVLYIHSPKIFCDSSRTIQASRPSLDILQANCQNQDNQFSVNQKIVTRRQMVRIK